MECTRRSFTGLSRAFRRMTADPYRCRGSTIQSESPRERTTIRNVGYKRIATEEAWAPAELLATYQKMAASNSIGDPGFITLWSRLGSRGELMARLGDIGEGRIRDMDAVGIDMQILSLTSPGVQVFDSATANAIAIASN